MTVHIIKYKRMQSLGHEHNASTSGENTLMDPNADSLAAGPSASSRLSSLHPAFLHSMDAPSTTGSPVSAPQSLLHYGSLFSPPGGPAHDLDQRLLPPTPPVLPSPQDKTTGFGEYLEASGRLRAPDRTAYTRDSSSGFENSPTDDNLPKPDEFTMQDSLFCSQRTIFDRQPTPSSIVLSTPNWFPSVDPCFYVDASAYEFPTHPEFRPGSALSSVASMNDQDLGFLVRSMSQALSTGSRVSQESYDGQLSDHSEEERRFYRTLLNDNDTNIGDPPALD